LAEDRVGNGRVQEFVAWRATVVVPGRRCIVTFYEVDPPGVEYAGDGEDRSEWFTSKAAAMRAIRALQKDVETEWAHRTIFLRRVKVRDLPRAELALRILNRRGWADKIEDLGEFTIPQPDREEGES
jgi:hypothetical protein